MHSDSIAPISFTDLLEPFLIDSSSLRGRAVRLGAVADTILRSHAYPKPVSELLGELLALTAMLGATLKYDGIFTVQLKGDGLVRFMVADCTSKGELRGYADVDGDMLGALKANKRRMPKSFRALAGNGHLAITVDQGEHTERYQGIVDLNGDSLTECVLHYFQHSEQLQVALKTIVGERKNGKRTEWVAGGIMLQRMPEEGGTRQIQLNAAHQDDGEREEQWRRASTFLHSVKKEELLDPALSLRDLIYRLYHEDGVWVFQPAHLTAHCRCSRTRISGILASMPADDIDAMKENGVITVTCQFCNKAEVFTDTDLTP